MPKEPRPSSYERINYGLRPAKNIERKILCEALRKLSAFGKIESYRYVGFGSTYFSDFILFHKSLGITNMLSIERDEGNRHRFEFNRPFSCVRIEFGESNEVLPDLQWDIPTILWLDYDGKLDTAVLTDVKFFCASAFPGSVIVVTVNAHPDTPPDGTPLEKRGEYRLQRLRDRVGEEKVPVGVRGEDLRHWGTADICRKIVTNEILQTLNERNGGRDPGSEFLYEQLFNFRYADRAKMLTVGGLLYGAGQSPLLAGCQFENIPFVRSSSEAYSIEVPNLTYREVRYLDAQLPVVDHNELLNEPKIPEADLERYARVYRYFPTFAEAEI